MRLWLVDAAGAVAGVAGDGAVPALLAPVRAGDRLAEGLAQRAADGDADAAGCIEALRSVLERHQSSARYLSPGSGWQCDVVAVLTSGPVAAVVVIGGFEASADEPASRPARAQSVAPDPARVQEVAGLGGWAVDLRDQRRYWSPETYAIARRDPALGPLSTDQMRARTHPADLPLLLAARARVIAGEPQVTARYRFRCDDGIERWLETRATLEPMSGHQTGILVGTVRDVTDEVAAVQGLEQRRASLENLVVSRTVALARASERADAADRARTDFLARVSHEIRTPLNSILTLTHLIQRAEPPGLQASHARAVEQAARQLSRVVDDLLDRARLDSRLDTEATSPVPVPAAGSAGADATAAERGAGAAPEVLAQGPAAGAGRPAAGSRPARAAAAPADPQDDSNAPAWAAVMQLRQRYAGVRVLLAEDDEVSRQAMVELLTAAALVVDTAADGREAVDLAARERYSLILLDLRMPRLDGLTAARSIRAMPGRAHIPLLAITANSFEEDRRACLAAGIDDLLPKPIDVHRLYRNVLACLDRAQADAATGADAPPPAPALPPAPVGAGPAWSVEALYGLDGIDAVGGLASVGGRPPVYRRLLEVFVRTHTADSQRLRELAAAGGGEPLVALAHRLRGSAATLGLIDIETDAAAVEAQAERLLPASSPGAPAGAAAGEAADTTVDLAARVDDLARTLDETLDRLRPALGDPPGP